MRLLSIGDVSRECGIEIHTLRRLSNAKRIPQPLRVRHARLFRAVQLPAIRRALVRLGYTVNVNGSHRAG
jgi:DNA-binding transcriptional MerR regulator